MTGNVIVFQYRRILVTINIVQNYLLKIQELFNHLKELFRDKISHVTA